MKALASLSHHWTRRLAPVALVLVLLALPLLVYVAFADTVVNSTAVYATTGTNALVHESSATLGDRIELASSVTGGKSSSRLDLSGSSHSLQVADTTPPTIVVTITPPSPLVGSGGWYKTNVSVVWEVTDAESAITSKVGCDPVYITQDQDPTTYTCTATSAGGTASKTTVPIKRDTTPPPPPEIAMTVNGNPYTSGTWAKDNVFADVIAPYDRSGIARCTSDQLLTTEGVNTFSADCTDKAGWISAKRTVSYSIDKTAPQANPVANAVPNSLGWYKKGVKIVWNWTDKSPGSGIGGVGVCPPETEPADGLTVPVSATCKDNAGNEGTGNFTISKVDKTPPVYREQSATTADGATYIFGTWTKQAVTVNFTCYDALSGAVKDKITRTQTDETPGTTLKAAAAECVDNAGNTAEGDGESGLIKIDKTPPNPPEPALDPKPNAYGWNRSAVTVSFISKGDKGVAQSGGVTCKAITNATLTQETSGTDVSGICTDAVGNVSDPATVNVKIDWTPPIYGTFNAGMMAASSDDVKAISKGADYIAGTWTNAQVDVSFKCNDDRSGYVTTPIVVSMNQEGKGQYAVASKADCKDKADNLAQNDRTWGPINIDKTKPVISGSRTPGPNIYGWNNSDVTVNFTCAESSDWQSGIGTKNLPSVLVPGPGQNLSATSTGSCVDVAGNIADPATVDGINIDKNNPNVPTVKVDPLPNNNGWNNTPVTVAFGSNGDAGTVQSGVVWCDPAKSLTSETPATGTLVSGTCKDKADRVSDPGTVTVKIDWTKPVITPTVPPGDYLVGCQAKPDFLVSDSISGVDGAPNVQGPTLTVLSDGSVWNRYTVTARDLAGNELTKQYDYLAYKTDGPFWQPPIDPNGTSLFKLGNTIPIKFQLFDCNNKAVTNADARLRVDFLGSAQPQNVPAQDVSPVSNAGGGDTGDKFRVTGDSYQYNWKTKDLWVGNYKISVKIGGVTIRSVTIGLR